MLITGGSASARAASTQERIEAVQEGKAQSESDLAEAQRRLESLENQRGDLEAYLSELSQQYEQLSASLQDLTGQARQKQKELKLVKKELKKAKEKEEQQYESMKIRISYMYENSRGSFLTTLLSADGLTDILTRAENFAQISKYDRDMLKKYEQSKEKVEDQKLAIKVEQEAIASLQAQTDEKRREIEELSASTQEEIAAYGQEIDRTEGEAASLLDLVNSQSVQLNDLMSKAEEEAEAARKAAEAELARQQQEEREKEEAARAAQQAEGSSREETVQRGDEPDVSAQETGRSVPEIETKEAGEAEKTQEAQETQEEETPQETEESAQETAAPEAAVTQTPDPEPAAQPEPTQPASDAGAAGSAGTYLGDFTLTAYCSCSICCGSWSGGGTASGTAPAAGRTVAMGGVPFGTKLLINGNVYTVEDRGTGYGHVDIYMNSHSAALQFGSQRASVYQLNN